VSAVKAEKPRLLSELFWSFKIHLRERKALTSLSQFAISHFFDTHCAFSVIKFHKFYNKSKHRQISYASKFSISSAAHWNIKNQPPFGNTFAFPLSCLHNLSSKILCALSLISIQILYIRFLLARLSIPPVLHAGLYMQESRGVHCLH